MVNEDTIDRAWALSEEYFQWVAKMQEVINCYAFEYDSEAESETLTKLEILFEARAEDLYQVIHDLLYPGLFSYQARIRKSQDEQ